MVAGKGLGATCSCERLFVSWGRTGYHMIPTGDPQLLLPERESLQVGTSFG